MMQNEQDIDSAPDQEIFRQGDLWDDEYVRLTDEDANDWDWEMWNLLHPQRRKPTKCIGRWPEARLKREFRYFRQRFWPDRLLDVDVTSDVAQKQQEIYVAGRPKRWWGFFDPTAKRILVNLSEHRTDREVRSIVLHEMCHAAAVPRSRGHDIYFFYEVEKLLQVGAPIRIDLLYYQEGRDVDPDLIDLLPHCAEIRKKREARARLRAVADGPLLNWEPPF